MDVRSQFATAYDVNLTPLPSLQHLTEDQRQADYRRMVGETQATAEAENEEKGRKPVGVAAILAQDPHSKPASTDRSPAPFVHAIDDSTEMEQTVWSSMPSAIRAFPWVHGRRLADFKEAPSRKPLEPLPRQHRGLEGN